MTILNALRSTAAKRRPVALPQMATLVLLALLLTARLAQADAFLFGTSDGLPVQLQLNTASGPVTLDTSTSEFTPGTRNQGWWSPTDGNANNNASYIVGSLSVGNTNFQFNNFFTFLLPEELGTITSANLLVERGVGTGPADLTYNLWDVSTPASVLNDKANNLPNAAIYNDLGSGTSYGSFLVSTSGNSTDILNFSLNANALADLNTHISDGGFFSIGGSISVPEPRIAGAVCRQCRWLARCCSSSPPQWLGPAADWALRTTRQRRHSQFARRPRWLQRFASNPCTVYVHAKGTTALPAAALRLGARVDKIAAYTLRPGSSDG